MGYMYEIKHEDAMDMKEHIKKSLYHAGRAMSIAEEMCEGGDMGYRYGDDMGYRGGGRGYMGHRMGYREEEPRYDEYGTPIDMRRMRDSHGRFM